MKGIWMPLALASLVLATACGSGKSNAEGPPMSHDEFLATSFETIEGDTASLKDYRGKVVLLVNVASKCGLTPQYEDLQALYEEYGADDFTIVGFPANNFLNQEPGSDEEIKQFCTTEYGVSFPMMSKISVKGADQHPVYRYLTEASPYPGEIRWNFDKFLLNKQGEVVARFHPRTNPRDEEVIAELKQTLGS